MQPLTAAPSWIQTKEWACTKIWIIVFGSILIGLNVVPSIIVGHAAPAQGDPWTSCAAYDEKTGDGYKDTGGCHLVYHLIDVFLCFALLFFAIYGYCLSCPCCKPAIDDKRAIRARRVELKSYAVMFNSCLSSILIYLLWEILLLNDIFLLLFEIIWQ